MVGGTGLNMKYLTAAAVVTWPEKVLLTPEQAVQMKESPHEYPQSGREPVTRQGLLTQ